ncbi:class I SAM-dependent methyltransferase [Spiroplasma tabanidicola]|uniref:Methyltransferase n=1 Tax=Spiroplasma tabanidicola TaxID=324079 RepID=A0A6I6CCR7_9MOLU|nr:class I SAM-dependent methyltransferase [Spiroplasma tabanidicola]QGS52088.1 methyltransferase [Spiroplasma tabanidicola]
MENQYKNYSCMLYDFTKPPGTSVDGDLEFYKNLLMPVEGKVLEAGVGNGRLLIPFLKYKIDIEGVDKSNEMLDLCLKNLKANNLKTTLIKADLKAFKKENYYEYIIMPNASICLIESRQELLKVLTNFYVSLISNGRLAIDLIMPNEYKKGINHFYTHNLKEFDLQVNNYSKEINWEEQFTITKIDYLINDQLVEQQEVKLMWYGIFEFEMILKSIGFKNIDIIKNYNNKTLINLKTITFIAKK